MNPNSKNQRNKLTAKVGYFLKSIGRTHKRGLANMIAEIERVMGKKCECPPQEFMREFIDWSNNRTRGEGRFVTPFKPLQLPKDLRLAAAKVADYPVPVSMSSRVTYAFQDHSR